MIRHGRCAGLSATYRYALRQNGFTDRIAGFGRLLEEF
jgi:hypothetical protein